VRSLTVFSTAGVTLAAGEATAGFDDAVLSPAGLGAGAAAVSGFAVTGDAGFSTLLVAVLA